MSQAKRPPPSYDKAKYHYETVEEEGLPREHAANHTMYFFRWLIERDLVSDFFREEGKEPLEEFRKGLRTIHDVYGSWDEVLAGDMLSDEGNGFAMAYFDFDKGAYLKEYEETLIGGYESTWHIPFTEENYQKMKALLDRRFEEWKSRPPEAESPEKTAKRWWWPF
jgi:hypothetical protein